MEQSEAQDIIDQKIIQLRSKINEYITNNYPTDSCATLFSFSHFHLFYTLKHTNFDVDSTLRNVEEFLELIIDIYHDGPLSKEELQKFTDDNFAYWQGINKNGALCLILKAQNFKACEYKSLSVLKYMLHLIELGESEMSKNKSSSGKFCMIVDRENFDKEKNSNNKLKSALIRRISWEIIMSNFFERLDEIYVININFAMRIMFSTFQYFYNDSLLNKVRVLSSMESLSDYFKMECLPDEYSGICISN